MENTVENIIENTSKHVCTTCKFATNYKTVIDKHMSSNKHKGKHNIETANKYSHICSKCERTYSTYSGLWKHQKKCTEIQSKEKENTVKMEIVEQNTETHEDIQTKIKMNIIKILLNHVNRDELNKIIDEMYDGK
jgi:hypothetical protein